MAEAQELQVAQAVQEAPEMDVIAPVLSLESLEKIEDPAKPEIQEKEVEEFRLKSFTEEEMKQIASLDMGYTGSRAKHFDPDFVRMCLGRRTH